MGNLVKITYPSSAVFERRHDGVDRLASVESGFDMDDLSSPDEVIAKFQHAGMGTRRLKREYWAGGGSAVMTQNLFYDAERRVVALDQFVNSGSTRIRGFGYAWDRENHRRWERRLSGSVNTSLNSAPDKETGPGEHYRYDSAYRLVHDDRDVSDGNLDLVDDNETTVPAIPVTPSLARDYQLDAAGNRRQTVVDGTATAYSLNQGAPTHDLALNQYSQIGNVVRSHDRAGNLISLSDTGRQQFFDADNRLVQWTEAGKDVRYRYDVDGRRVMKVGVGSSSFDPILFWWDGWQTVEETNSAGTMQRQYVYGEGLDEVVKATVPDAPNLVAGDSIDLYFHHNSLGSVVAVTKADGTVVESYRYSAFGQPRFFDHTGSEVGTSPLAQPFLFTGARWDAESSLYQMRLRFYDPVAGRFVSRDPLGMWGDAAQNGNGQSYCGHDPVNGLDPLGDRSWRTGEDGRNWIGSNGYEWTGSGAMLDTYKALDAAFDAIQAELQLARRGKSKHSVADLEKALNDTGFARAEAERGNTELNGKTPETDPIATMTVGGMAHGALLGSALDILIALGFGFIDETGVFPTMFPVRGGRCPVPSSPGRGGTRVRPPKEEPQGSKPRNQSHQGENPNCFPAGTLVVTSTGRKPIESVEVGDLVLSRDDQTGETAFKPVTRVFRNQTEELCQLALKPVRVEGDQTHLGHEREQATSEGDLSIECTPGHVVFAWGRGWIHAEHLREGDHLVGSDGLTLCVTETTRRVAAVQTFNIEVQGWHTYFVSTSETGSGLWVHNTSVRNVTPNEAPEIGVVRIGPTGNAAAIGKRPPGGHGKVAKDGGIAREHPDDVMVGFDVGPDGKATSVYPSSSAGNFIGKVTEEQARAALDAAGLVGPNTKFHFGP